MPSPLTIEFYGPFSWTSTDDNTSVFKSSIAAKLGVYLWTVSTSEGELIYYVGQTGRSFSVRMREHFEQQLSGMYMVYEPELFAQGKKQVAWQGMLARGQESRIPEYLERLPELLSAVLGFAKQMRFFLAPLDCEERLRKRIEGAIYDYPNNQPGVIGDFQDKGLRHIRRRSDEEPVEVVFKCPVVLRGLPASLRV